MNTRRDSFYVYLNSKFNLKEYPNNNATSFTNNLKPTLTHASEYEVGLVNIMFKPEYYVIRKNDDTYFINLHFNYETVEGNVGGFFIKYMPENNITASNIYELIQYLNNDIYSFLLRQKLNLNNIEQIFRYRQFR